MSNIDEIIARSRQPGEFSERKSFTVSRERAIRKMREFALADPYFYVLELIQAAIASRATHVDMQIDAKNFILSYVGGGFREVELSQIFDFLFASKADVETGAIRQLALGLNALMRFEPAQIIIESGDGTLAGTTRVEINQRKNVVDVGTPEAALNGTFLRAAGMQRSKVRGQSTLSGTDYGPEETSIIESRCLVAPVPIIVNGHSIFGYTSIRSPRLPGYEHVMQFDEGELYGSIGVARQPRNQVFKLLTWGVWVESVEFPLIKGNGFGGVVTFNGLNKTADHAAIVQDERYRELWARLRVYARMALSEETGAAGFEVARLGEAALEPREIRALIDANSVVVTVDPRVLARPAQLERAQAIGEALGAPVLTVPQDELGFFIDLAGGRTEVLRPQLGSSVDLALLTAPPAEPPPRPWVLGEIDAPGLRVEALFARLRYDEAAHDRSWSRAAQDRFIENLGGARSEYRATIYTPQKLPSAPRPGDAEAGGWARVHVANRVVWEGPVDSPYPGHILDIRAPVRSPAVLLAPSPFQASKTLVESIAQTLANLAEEQLEAANSQALERLRKEQVRPGTSGARIALAALARESIMRIHEPDNAGEAVAHAEIRFDLLSLANAQNLGELALFNAVDGRAISLRDLEAIMGHTHGLVYGTVPEIPAHLDGLDPSRILSLDLQTEALLIEIVGHSAYIRVDSRDILARSRDGRWLVRDLAYGLRAYPDAALLVEGAGAQAGATPDEAIIEELVRALQLTLSDGLGESERDEFDEARRQAARHLRYFVCRRRLTEPELPTYEVEHLGLFWDAHLRATSLAQIRAGFDEFGSLVMLDGRAADNPRAGRDVDPSHVPRALMLDPWSFQLLAPLGRVIRVFDEAENSAASPDLSAEFGTQSDALRVAAKLNSKTYRGQIGLPKVPVEAAVIRVISADKSRVSLLRQSSVEFGVVGSVELKEATKDWTATLKRVEAELHQESLILLHEVLEQLPKLQEGDYFPATLALLLSFAGRRLQLRRHRTGRVRLSFAGEGAERVLATRILEAPYFAIHHGVPVGAMRLLRQACLEEQRGEKLAPSARVELTDAVPAPLVAWLERVIKRIESTPRITGVPRPAPPEASRRAPDSPLALAPRVEKLLRALRPDTYAADRAEEYNPRGEVSSRIVDSYQAKVRSFDFAGQAPDGLAWPVRVLVDDADADAPFVYANDPPPQLLLNEAHPLIKAALDAAPGDDEPIAWLLLAAYAHINALLKPVTNEHELIFQRRVLNALMAGELA